MEAMSRVTTALTGSLLLLDDGSEGLRSSMRGLRVIMAIVNATVAFQNLKLRENAKLQSLLNFSIKNTVKSLGTFKTAIVGVGLGLAITAIVALISASDNLNTAYGRQMATLKLFGNVQADAMSNYTKEKNSIEALSRIINNNNEFLSVKNQAYKELQKLVPELAGYTYDEAIATGVLTTAINKQTEAIQKRALTNAFSEAIAAKELEIFKKRNQLEEEERGILSDFGAAFKGLKTQFDAIKNGVLLSPEQIIVITKAKERSEELTKLEEEKKKLQEEYNNVLRETLQVESEIVDTSNSSAKDKKKLQDKLIANQYKLLGLQEKQQEAEVKLQGEKNLALKKTDEERIRSQFITQNRLLDIQEQFAEERLSLNSNDASEQLKYQTTIDGINQQRLINENNLNDQLLKIKEKGILDAAEAEKNRGIAIQESLDGTLKKYDDFYSKEEVAIKQRYIDGVTDENQYLDELNQLTLEKLLARLAIYKAFGLDVTDIENQIADLRIKINQNANKEIANDAKRLTRVVQQSFNQLAKALGDAISEGVAAAVSGKSGLQAFFNSILIAIGGFLQNIGAGLIATATAVEAFQKTLAVNPAAAIPIGLAAIAAGAALKATIDKGVAFAEGGIVSAPTLGLVGEYPGASTNPEVIAPLNKLKGMLDMNGGGEGGYIAETRVSGRDLAIVLNRYNKDAKRI